MWNVCPSPDAASMAEVKHAPVRRARISTEAIAATVLAIGFDNVTVKNVADRLGITVAGLYHHVRGRDDLLRIGSEFLLSNSELPPYTGQPWPDWLREVCWFLRAHLAAHPELLMHYLDSATAFNLGIAHLEVALDVLARFGFAPVEGMHAFHAVGQLAVGSAVDELRDLALTKAGRPPVALLYGALALDPDGFPRVREMMEQLGRSDSSLFNESLTIVLRGIAAAHGEDWAHALATVAPAPVAAQP